MLLSWYLASKLLAAVADLFAVPNSIASVFLFTNLVLKEWNRHTKIEGREQEKRACS